MEDYYNVLGLQKDCSASEIKSAYKKLAKIHHPDAGGNESEFKKIVEAYETLSDADKRKAYDMRGSMPHGAQFGGFSSYEEMMSNVFSSFGFGRTTRRSRAAERGTDVRINMSLTLSEILTGITKKIKYKRNHHCEQCRGVGAQNESDFMICTSCHGSGQRIQIINSPIGQMQTASTCQSCNGEGKQIKQKCSNCHGNGVVNQEEIIDISIPPGVAEGMNLEVANKGNQPKGVGQSGRLIILITEEKHPEFYRVGNHIHYDLFISIPDAILGNSNIEIPIIDGRAKIKIEAGTENGKVLRLPGKGLPELNNTSVLGDMFIHVNVFIPKKLSEKDISCVEEIEKSENFKVNSEKIQGIKGSFNRSVEFKTLF
jgi:molecular chaperone DnaJ